MPALRELVQHPGTDKAMSTTIPAPPVARIAAVQTALMLVLAIASFFLWGRVSAGSLLLGGLISILPNAYFAHKVFRHRGARAMTQTVQAIYMGELIKLALMGAGFALAFKYVRPLNAIALFAGFVFAHVTGIAALAIFQAPARK